MSILVAAFSGSLRRESYTTRLVHAFRQQAPKEVTVNLIGIGDLPLINQDLENDLPDPVNALHQSIAAADAILLATPEYNRSYSPVLKNALDWGSRPLSKNKWAQKPTAIIGCSPYLLGAFGAENHLRQVTMYLDMYVLQQPEFYLSRAGDKFDEQGELTDAATRDLINGFWIKFVDWIHVVGKKPGAQK